MTCIDCEKPLKKPIAKRCQSCNMRLISKRHVGSPYGVHPRVVRRAHAIQKDTFRAKGLLKKLEEMGL